MRSSTEKAPLEILAFCAEADVVIDGKDTDHGTDTDTDPHRIETERVVVSLSGWHQIPSNVAPKAASSKSSKRDNPHPAGHVLISKSHEAGKDVPGAEHERSCSTVIPVPPPSSKVTIPLSVKPAGHEEDTVRAPAGMTPPGDRHKNGVSENEVHIHPSSKAFQRLVQFVGQEENMTTMDPAGNTAPLPAVAIGID